jgi:hypothetical protein
MGGEGGTSPNPILTTIISLFKEKEKLRGEGYNQSIDPRGNNNPTPPLISKTII